MAKKYRISELAYEVRKSKRARNIRLTVHLDGTVVVTAPLRVKQETIKELVLRRLDWIRGKIGKIAHLKNSPLATFGREEYLRHKERAHALIQRRLGALNQAYNCTYSRITIRNQKSRWGSCSSKRTLSFNYKILFLPENVADYILAHELCHLRHPNHSSAFWQFLETGMPDYRDRRAKLQTYILHEGN